MDPDAIAARIDELKAKRSARAGKGGFKRNVAAIDEEIARLEAELAGADTPQS